MDRIIFNTHDDSCVLKTCHHVFLYQESTLPGPEFEGKKGPTDLSTIVYESV